MSSRRINAGFVITIVSREGGQCNRHGEREREDLNFLSVVFYLF